MKQWNEKYARPDGTRKDISSYSSSKHPRPFLAGVISDESLPRVYRILDAIFTTVESLDGSITDDLSLMVRNEKVQLEINEMQNEE